MYLEFSRWPWGSSHVTAPTIPAAVPSHCWSFCMNQPVSLTPQETSGCVERANICQLYRHISLFKWPMTCFVVLFCFLKFHHLTASNVFHTSFIAGILQHQLEKKKHSRAFKDGTHTFDLMAWFWSFCRKSLQPFWSNGKVWHQRAALFVDLCTCCITLLLSSFKSL